MASERRMRVVKELQYQELKRTKKLKCTETKDCDGFLEEFYKSGVDGSLKLKCSICHKYVKIKNGKIISMGLHGIHRSLYE